MSMNELKNKFENQMGKDLLKNPNLSWWLSWPIIIITTIIFWPVGIFLIWRRVTIDKKTAMLSGNVISILGWVSIAIAVLGFIGSTSAGISGEDIGFIIFFIIAGIALIFLGKRTKNNANKFKKYISIVINNQITSIDNIAAAIPTSYDACKKDLQKMIDKGYFAGAYIDEFSREIILPKQNNNVNSELSVNNVKENVEFKVVSCKGCGANNTIVKGSVGECEFCGSAIA